MQSLQSPWHSTDNAVLLASREEVGRQPWTGNVISQHRCIKRDRWHSLERIGFKSRRSEKMHLGKRYCKRPRHVYYWFFNQNGRRQAIGSPGRKNARNAMTPRLTVTRYQWGTDVMPEHVHGHEVMKMMIDDGRVYTRATLRAAIAQRFGEGTRFFTCSAQDMTADELVTFLEARGKFIPEGEGFRTEADRMCQH